MQEIIAYLIARFPNNETKISLFNEIIFGMGLISSALTGLNIVSNFDSWNIEAGSNINQNALVWYPKRFECVV